MRPPKNPELAFLIEALSIDPDVFFGRVFIGRESCQSLHNHINDVVAEITTNTVGNIELRNYTPEIVDAWCLQVQNQGWASIDSENTNGSVFEHIRKLAKKCLSICDGNPCFKMEKLYPWQLASFGCGEDLFVATLLADRSINMGIEPVNFQWDYILKSDFLPLNDMIARRGLTENHAHLGGAQPLVDISWIYLMNYPFNQTDKYTKIENRQHSFYTIARGMGSYRRSKLEYMIHAAARIRLWLYCKLYGNTFSFIENPLDDISQLIEGQFSLIKDKMEDCIDVYRFLSPLSAYGIKVDYAISTNPNMNVGNGYLSGERELLYHSLKHILQAPDDAYTCAIFHLYLLIKRRFNQMFIQQNNKTGFQNFKDYNDRKSDFIAGTPYYYLAQNMAIQWNIIENNIKQIELRTLPYDSINKMRKKYADIDRKAFLRPPETTFYDRVFNEQGDRIYSGINKFFFVMHFTKQKSPSWNEEEEDLLLCREDKKRKEYKKQAHILRQLRDSRDYFSKRILGIDGASNEVNFRPENFGPAFRYLSASNIRPDAYGYIEGIPDLKRTFHVGEDFYDVVDGLRAIDEAVLFLELRQGDRIGHGVALGIDVDKWYNVHNNAVAMPKQNKLDNLVWMLSKASEWKIDISTTTYERIHTRIERLFQELHGQVFPGLLTYMDAWALRGDDPEVYESPSWDGQGMARNDDWDKIRVRDMEKYGKLKKEPSQAISVYQLYHDYHFNRELKKRAKEVEKMEFWPEYIDLVKQLQIHMKALILDKGIGVESCPSSNFLISNLDEFREIPTFNLFPIKEESNDFVRLNVCINTDDQGVFYTSLSKEYALLIGALRKDMNNGYREHSDDKIMEWVEKLISNGELLCFRRMT